MPLNAALNLHLLQWSCSVASNRVALGKFQVFVCFSKCERERHEKSIHCSSPLQQIRGSKSICFVTRSSELKRKIKPVLHKKVTSIFQSWAATNDKFHYQPLCWFIFLLIHWLSDLYCQNEWKISIMIWRKCFWLACFVQIFKDIASRKAKPENIYLLSFLLKEQNN